MAIFNTLLGVLAKVGMALLTEKMLARLVLWGTEKIVKSTKNTLDDEFYNEIKGPIEKEFGLSEEAKK